MTVDVAGLNLLLGPGTYRLTVAPIDSGGSSGERVFVSTTSGANAIALPAGNDGNSFWDSADYGKVFVDPATDLSLPDNTRFHDFSMGIGGTTTTTVPEPVSLVLLGSGLAVARCSRRRRSG